MKVKIDGHEVEADAETIKQLLGLGSKTETGTQKADKTPETGEKQAIEQRIVFRTVKPEEPKEPREKARKCLICHEEIPKGSWRKRYCSQECADKGNEISNFRWNKKHPDRARKVITRTDGSTVQISASNKQEDSTNKQIIEDSSNDKKEKEKQPKAFPKEHIDYLTSRYRWVHARAKSLIKSYGYDYPRALKMATEEWDSDKTTRKTHQKSDAIMPEELKALFLQLHNEGTPIDKKAYESIGLTDWGRFVAWTLSNIAEISRELQVNLKIRFDVPTQKIVRG